MKNTTKFIIIAIALFYGDAGGQEHVGFLKSVSGKVEIKREGSSLEAHPGLR